jgi:K+-sensing histidine kinase KdpD
MINQDNINPIKEPDEAIASSEWHTAIQSLADQIKSLEEARAMERERYSSLLDIAAVLSSTLNLPRLLDIILDSTVKLTNTAASSILLIDRQTGNLYFEATSNMPPAKMERIEVPLEGSIAGWVAQHGQPRVIQQVKSEEQFTVPAQIDRMTRLSTESLLAVPLKVKGDVIGVLEVMNKKDKQLFTHEDVETLLALAGQAAVAIENVRLFQQSDFISEMVHELRTPLTALVALSEALTRPDLPAERRNDFAETIQREARRLSHMASSFLELSRLESGRVRLKQEPVVLADIVRDTVTVQGPQAAEREIRIATDIPETIPTLIGDPNRIKQILLNLVSNAIKYNRQGGSISISARPEEQMIRLSVCDTGNGIPPEAIKNLFKRFYRVPDTEGFISGTGLGLLITQRIVQQHGGKIWVRSSLGKGSCFYFTLPLPKDTLAKSQGHQRTFSTPRRPA